MAYDLNLYKGMREFSPSEYKKLEKITKSWEKISLSFGFLQYKTPILEPTEIYKGKTSEEIVENQMYTFSDKKGRSVTIRPEITPSVARLVGDMKKNRNFISPLKMFTIGSVYRYEKEQLGRKREHIQLNADIFGVEELWADAEIISLAVSILLDLGLNKNDFEILVNDRKEMTTRLKESGVEDTKQLFTLLDKKGKMERVEFEKELEKIAKIDLKTLEIILDKEPAIIKKIKDILPHGIDIKYNSKVIRGFDYYDGMVFEIFSTKKDSSRSIVGGGRYNGLIEKYTGEKVPAVGFGIGDVMINEIIDNNEKRYDFDVSVLAKKESDIQQASFFSGDLRKKGFTVSNYGVNFDSKLYKKAEMENIKYFIIVDDGKITIRDLRKRKNIFGKMNPIFATILLTFLVKTKK